jgi:hypothetical protein
MRNAVSAPSPAARSFLCKLVGFLAASLYLAVSSAGAAATFTSSFRDVTTFASVDRVQGEDPFCTSDESSDQGGGFDQTVNCQAGEGGNRALGTASQLSYIQLPTLIAEGSFQASAEIDGEATFAEGFGGSRLISEFSIDEAIEIRLMATIFADGNGTANLVFRLKDGTILVYRSIHDTSDSIDERITLPPGIYELTATVGGFGQALQGGGGEPARGSFALSMHFPDTADVEAPTVLASARSAPGIVPNPVRGQARILPVTGSGLLGRDVRILDLAGRAVRRLQDLPPEGLEWDATDDAGRSLPAGIYLVRDAMGRSSKAIVLR